MASRIADIFTNGGYSKALEERDKLAASSLGSSGYTRSQTEAMRMARDLAKSHNATVQGQSMNENIPLGQRIAMAVNPSVENDMASAFHNMDVAGVDAAENRVAQQQANAMNAQERLFGGLQSAVNAADTGFKLGMTMPKQQPGKAAQQQAFDSMKANAGKNGMPSNLTENLK